jgi:hypothetical protein
VTLALNEARRAAQRAKLIAARPPKLEIIFPWARLGIFEDISFAATPGPGYSEGGDVFSPAQDALSSSTGKEGRESSSTEP